MSGVRVIWKLLYDSSLQSPTVVQSANIRAGTLPIDTQLPAISVESISSVQRQTLAMSEARRMHTDRVQVTALVKTQQGYPQGGDYANLVSIMDFILAACGNQTGVVNGVTVDSILPESEGPDFFIDDQSIITRSRDFMVRWVPAT